MPAMLLNFGSCRGITGGLQRGKKRKRKKMKLNNSRLTSLASRGGKSTEKSLAIDTLARAESQCCEEYPRYLGYWSYTPAGRICPGYPWRPTFCNDFKPLKLLPTITIYSILVAVRTY